MNLNINQYGQFSGGNSLIISGTGICSDSRLYPNNAYYRFNKLRDEGDWPSDISGIYYGKGDCINCPKSHLKNFKDFSWKEVEGEQDFRLQGETNQETLQNHKITDINQFLMLNSKVGVADIHYKFLGPAFQRLVVGYQVFWPMQGYQNPTNQFDTNYKYAESFGRSLQGTISSVTAANNPEVGEWMKNYDGQTMSPWGGMKRKIMGEDYRSPSISQISKLNMGAWNWPEKQNSFQWYINSNFNGPPKISGFESGLNKKFSELRIIFDSCSVSNIENRVRVPCPSPGSHIFAGKSLLANPNLKYRFHPSDLENRGLVGCFVEYFALIFTDKEKDTLNVDQLGIVAARSGYNFYDVNDSSTFDDLLQQYGLSIQGGSNISGEASVEITGFGLPRGVNINLCSNQYFNWNLDRFMNLFNDTRNYDNSTDLNRFCSISCGEDGRSIYSPDFDKFSGINVASGLEQSWPEPKGLWTSGHYLDPPFYNGGFLDYGDAKYMGLQKNFLGTVTEPSAPNWDLEYIDYDPNFYPEAVDYEGISTYAFANGYTEWFCKEQPSSTPAGFFVQNRGYIPGKWIYLTNAEFTALGGLKLFIPINPLYFIHGHAGALLTPFDGEMAGGGFSCESPSVLNRISPCNPPAFSDDQDTNSYTSNNTHYRDLLNTPTFFYSEALGSLSVAAYLEDPIVT